MNIVPNTVRFLVFGEDLIANQCVRLFGALGLRHCGTASIPVDKVEVNSFQK